MLLTTAYVSAFKALRVVQHAVLQIWGLVVIKKKYCLRTFVAASASEFMRAREQLQSAPIQ